MVRYELLLEAREGLEQPFGSVLALKPQGIWISPAEWAAWVGNDRKRPASVDTIDLHTQAIYERAIKRERLLTSLGGDHMAFWSRVMGHTNFPEEEALAGAGEVDFIRLTVAAQGMDSNWGFDELKIFGALIFDVAPVAAEGLVMPKYDFGAEGIGKSKRLAEHAFRVPVENILSGASLDTFKDIDSVYQVNRNFPQSAPPVLESV